MPRPASLPLVRLLALAGFFWFGVTLVTNVLQTWDTFSPSYWAHYAQQQLAQPLSGLAASTLLALFARPVARRLDRD